MVSPGGCNEIWRALQVIEKRPLWPSELARQRQRFEVSRDGGRSGLDPPRREPPLHLPDASARRPAPPVVLGCGTRKRLSPKGEGLAFCDLKDGRPPLRLRFLARSGSVAEGWRGRVNGRELDPLAGELLDLLCRDLENLSHSPGTVLGLAASGPRRHQPVSSLDRLSDLAG